ncbi:zinc-ribbon domain-containing protein [candidate division KSB1 bacterium]|nr:zinc-ribbon domain-containing protein [candidate division KSB1 bacterium]
MSEITAYIMMFLLVAFILEPLFRAPRQMYLNMPHTPSVMNEWLYQKRVAAEIIGDLDFDHQTGKLSDSDYRALKDSQEQVVSELDEKIRRNTTTQSDEMSKKLMADIEKAKKQLAQQLILVCPQCGHRMTRDAKFCSQCGAKLN